MYVFSKNSFYTTLNKSLSKSLKVSKSSYYLWHGNIFIINCLSCFDNYKCRIMWMFIIWKQFYECTLFSLLHACKRSVLFIKDMMNHTILNDMATYRKITATTTKLIHITNAEIPTSVDVNFATWYVNSNFVNNSFKGRFK